MNDDAGLMLLLLANAALASEPVVERGEDSWIEAHVDVAAAPTKVLELVSDPEAVARIDGSTQVKATPDGPCFDVETHVEHPIASASYTTRSCPDGEMAVKQTLTGGKSMKEFESRWWVEPRGNGSRLHYRIRTISTLPVPQFIVDRATVKGATRVLERVSGHLEAADPPP